MVYWLLHRIATGKQSNGGNETDEIWIQQDLVTTVRP